MVAVVSTARLDRIPSGRRLANGKREFLATKISKEELDEIRRGVASALGLWSPSGRVDISPAGTIITVVPARGFGDSG